MRSKVEVGYSDRDAAERAALVSEYAAAEAAVAAAHAASARILARAAAHAARATRTKAAREHELALRSIAAELACATRLSDRTVQRRINDADTLVTGFPETLTAWEAGTISHGHVRAVVDAGLTLEGDDRGLFDRAAVAICQAETPAGARAMLRMLAEELHPQSFTERHEVARETRGARVAPLPDGMAELIVILPALLAHAIHDRLTRQARTVKDATIRARSGATDEARARAGMDADAGLGTAAAPDSAPGEAPADHRDPGTEAVDADREHREIVASDERTLDQVRADLVADMLLTAAPTIDPAPGDSPGELGAIRAHVQVVVPVLTAAGHSNDPADLAGHGPIDADTARRLIGQETGFDRVLTHPITGTVLTVDRYTPSVALARHLRARDQHCRFPGCRVPTHRCDIDHTHDHADGGPTTHTNLAHLCRRHHTLKHATSWTVRQTPGGVLHWTTPTGHEYSTTPPPPRPHGAHPPRGAPTPHAALPSDGARPTGGAHPRRTTAVRFVPDPATPPF